MLYRLMLELAYMKMTESDSIFTLISLNENKPKTKVLKTEAGYPTKQEDLIQFAAKLSR